MKLKDIYIIAFILAPRQKFPSLYAKICSAKRHSSLILVMTNIYFISILYIGI